MIKRNELENKLCLGLSGRARFVVGLKVTFQSGLEDLNLNPSKEILFSCESRSDPISQRAKEGGTEHSSAAAKRQKHCF